MRLRWIPFVFVFVLALASNAFAFAPGAVALEAKLLAPCCWGGTLDVHDSELAQQLRQEIDKRLVAGETSEVIEADLVMRYGPRIRALPSETALSASVIASFGAVAAAGIALTLMMRRWRRTSIDDRSTPVGMRTMIASTMSSEISTEQIPSTSSSVSLEWIIRLRWGAVFGQGVTLLVAALGFKLQLELFPLLVLVGLTVLSNIALAIWRRRTTVVPPWLNGLVFVADTLILTGLLYWSGGPSNPFSVLYLVHVTLAALVLGIRWAAVIVVSSAAAYAALFFWNVPLAMMQHAHHDPRAFSLHLQGMWFAFAIAAALIGYFVSRVAGALREREAELAHTRKIAARTERLISLSTLAAGAAHELGTPLGTIAVAANELERSLPPEAEATADARLIRQELDRCRTILERMSGRAADFFVAPVETSTSAVIQACRERLRDPSVEIDGESTAKVTVAVDDLVQVLVSLVQNALYASEESKTPVSLSVERENGKVRFVVRDRGRGVTGEILERIGEPFFTTKPAGQGMGLGLFLARAFADRHSGSIAFTSEEGKGTSVVLELPAADG